jgi:hypothetical protein
VEAAISAALTACGGVDGCVSMLAAAYGDHPETAVPRMKWARQTIDAMRSADRPLSASRKKPAVSRSEWATGRPDASILLAPNARHSVRHAAIVSRVNVGFMPAAMSGST